MGAPPGSLFPHLPKALKGRRLGGGVWTQKVPKARLVWSPTRPVTSTGELVGDAQLVTPELCGSVCTVKPPSDSYAY